MDGVSLTEKQEQPVCMAAGYSPAGGWGVTLEKWLTCHNAFLYNLSGLLRDEKVKTQSYQSAGLTMKHREV